MVKKRILLVTDSYPPEIRSASELMSELAQGLVDKNYHVIVMTTWPKFNLDNTYQNRKYKTDQYENSVRVIRVKSLPHHNVKYIIRAIAQIIMPFQFLAYYLIYSIKVDTVILYSPPLPLAIFGVWLRIFNVKFLLNLQDIFPQNAIDLGILKNKYQICFFKIIEKYVYKKSDIITVHSEGNRKLIIASYPDITKKVLVLHNWIDLDKNPVENSVINVRKLWGISHEYIGIFAGVMGPSQNLELIIRVAEKVGKKYPNLVFLLIGNGSERKRIEKLSTDLMLTNVLFKDFVDPILYRQIVRQCSFGIVSLSPDNKTPVVPGKILGYMAASIPIVGFLHKESDGHQIIQSAQCGVSAISSNLSLCIDSLLKFMDSSDCFSSIGRNGFLFAKNNYDKEKILSQFEAFF